MKKFYKKGFTLIELLVVVAIIAILALIVLLALNPVEMARRSRDSRRLSDLGTIRRAIDLALADKQSLVNADFDISTSTLVTAFDGVDGGTLNISKYLSVVPQDPVNDGSVGTVQVISYDGTDCVPTTGIDKGTMVYHYWSDGNNYVLSARLESMENCIAILQDGNTDGNYQIGTDPGLDEVTDAP